MTATRYYTFAGSTVAVRTNDGRLALMLGDEQGSTNVMMPVQVEADGTLRSATIADAEAVTRTSYTPYGELRGADNLATDRGWLGQVEDRVDGASGTGLTYLNARYYDPVLSRFLSPDPLMNPDDPRTLDAYRYADNNPVSFTDASGLRPTCASGGALDQDACYYGTRGVELNPYLPDPFEGGLNREYDRGMNGPKRPHKVGKSTGDWLFLPKMAVNFLGGALNAGISTVNGAIWLGSTITSGPPPPIPSVPVWDGDSPERGRFYYWASYTGSAGLVVFGPKVMKLRPGSSATASDAKALEVSINVGKQDKYIPGAKNFLPGRSELTVDPQTLVNRAGTGAPANSVPRGAAGYKERVNFAPQTIGKWTDGSGAYLDTTVGTFIYDAKGTVHIVPARPAS